MSTFYRRYDTPDMPMRGLLSRAVGIVVGVLLLMATTQDGPGTFLGLYPPNTAQRIGYDLGRLAIDAVALWAIYKGIRPRRKIPADN